MRRLVTAAGADKTNAEPFVGPLDAFVGNSEVGLKHACRGCRRSRGAEKIAIRRRRCRVVSVMADS